MSTDLLHTALYLANRSGGSTSADLCASVSTTYYALFETLAKLAADLFIGRDISSPPPRAWRHIYRSLEHTRIADKCSKESLQRFPQSIIDFADFFMFLQHERQLSDYEYKHAPDLNFVLTTIERAKIKISALLATEEKHLRAFCVFIMIEKHRHEDKRKNLHPKVSNQAGA